MHGILLCAGAIKGEVNKQTQQQPFPNYSLPFTVGKSVLIRMEPHTQYLGPAGLEYRWQVRAFCSGISPRGVSCRGSN